MHARMYAGCPFLIVGFESNALFAMPYCYCFFNGLV